MVTQAPKVSSRLLNLTYIRLAGVVIGASLLGGWACKPKSKPASAQMAASSAPAPSAAPVAVPSSSTPPMIVPKGPAYAIEAGTGLGPVRFGATVATIERLMEAKCDETTENYCRYVDAGIEFELSKGVVSGITVYRHDRPVAGSPGKNWGRTRCAIRPDITPRVVVSYVRSVLGKPLTSEPVTTENPNRTALRETYKGLVLEYDRGERTGELILGSIHVKKADMPASRVADVPPVVH